MRLSVGVLACVGAVCVAYADAALADPATPVPAQSASAPAAPMGNAPVSGPAAAPSASPAVPTAAAAASSAAPTARPPATSTATSAPAAEAAVTITAEQEKQLRAAGYKPEMNNGEQIWCRREAALGSRVNAQKTCGTAKSLAVSIQETQDRFRATQSKQWSPTTH